jgi:GH15 family glucan-1,4-alpha-glucosidase
MALTIVDFMPPRTNDPTVVRLVEGVRGRVSLHTEMVIRFDHGSIVPWVRRVDEALSAVGGPDALWLRTSAPTTGRDLTTVADFTVSQGERVSFSLAWRESHRRPPRPIDPIRALEETEEWWRHWSQRCTYEGKYREAVVRSLITLKALSYRPTGGIVAAATTSLPEHGPGPGGTGCSGQWPAIRSSCRSCMGRPGSGA